MLMLDCVKHIVRIFKPANFTLKGICIFVDSHSFSHCTLSQYKFVRKNRANYRVLARTYVMIEEILAYEEQIAKLKGSSNADVKSKAQNQSEIERMKKELEKKERDLENLKRQAAGNNKAYDELADAHAKATTRPGDAKKDL
jgi:Bap31/Bap29 cytoplasmic coiled-coil domain